jgi:LPXTG-site transpeptidase (sortase) family protein
MQPGKDDRLDIGSLMSGSDNNPTAAAEARARIAELASTASPVLSQPGGMAAVRPVSPQLPERRSFRMPSRTRPIITALATFLGLLLLFRSNVLLTQLNYAFNKPEQPPATPVVQTETVSPDPIISIPKINVSAPVIYGSPTDEPSIQRALQNGVVHYTGTALPGQPGNSVIVGHSSNDPWEPGHYKFVFVLLDKLVVGDTFSVNHDSKKYVYEVTEVKVVEPTDLSVLRQTTEPTMTLITCTPPGTAWKRLIIKAKQVSPNPTTVHAPVTTSPEQVNLLPGNAPSILDQIGRIFGGLKDAVTGIF